MDLETSVSQAVFAARLMERALHEPEGWTMGWCGILEPATRVLRPDSISLIASFPGACWLSPEPTSLLLLRHNGEVLGVRHIEHPGDGGFDIEWTLAAQTVQV